jgi:hypothetical protein
MQKKYALESSIIDVEFCEDNKMWYIYKQMLWIRISRFYFIVYRK